MWWRSMWQVQNWDSGRERNGLQSFAFDEVSHSQSMKSYFHIMKYPGCMAARIPFIQRNSIPYRKMEVISY
jgi:hypothetical protein